MTQPTHAGDARAGSRRRAGSAPLPSALGRRSALRRGAQRLALWLCLTSAGGALGSLGGCAKDSDLSPAPPVCASVEGGQPVSPALLAFLSRARSGHHAADQLEQDRPEQAIAKLQAIVDGPIPGGNTPLVEAREVLADTRARLADLKSQAGSFADALADINAGLEQAKETSYFRGHLFEVRGLVEERQSKQHSEQGDATGAAAAKQRALTAFEASMDIQERVIEQNLPEAP